MALTLVFLPANFTATINAATTPHFDTLARAAAGKTIIPNPVFVNGGPGWTGMGPANLFDGRTNTVYRDNFLPFWADWKYDRAYIVDRLILATGNNQNERNERMDDGWTFSGSNDGTNWEVIYTGKASDTADINNAFFVIDLPNNKNTYQYYRVFSNFGFEGRNIVQLSQVILCGTPHAYVPPPPPEQITVTAKPSTQRVFVNGEEVAFAAYLINGNNYFKLRDIAAALKDTESRFSVGWDNIAGLATIEIGKPYQLIGGELEVGNLRTEQGVTSTTAFLLNYEKFTPQAYLINGSNYIKLRDMGDAFRFWVGWDAATSSVQISTKFRPATGIQLMKEIKVGLNWLTMQNNILPQWDAFGGFGSDSVLPEDYPWDEYNQPYYENFEVKSEMFKAIAAKGFNAVRIAAHFESYMDENLIIASDWLDTVQRAVDYALESGLYVSLFSATENHFAYALAFNDEPKAIKYFTAIWSQIAERFKDYPERLIFELYEMPLLHPAGTGRDEFNAITNKLMNHAHGVIRDSGGYNDKRVIVFPASQDGHSVNPGDTFYGKTFDRQHWIFPSFEALILPDDDPYIMVLKGHYILPPYEFNATEEMVIWEANRIYEQLVAQRGVGVLMGEVGMFDCEIFFGESTIDAPTRLKLAKAFFERTAYHGFAVFLYDMEFISDLKIFDEHTYEWTNIDVMVSPAFDAYGMPIGRIYVQNRPPQFPFIMPAPTNADMHPEFGVIFYHAKETNRLLQSLPSEFVLEFKDISILDELDYTFAYFYFNHCNEYAAFDNGHEYFRIEDNKLIFDFSDLIKYNEVGDLHIGFRKNWIPQKIFDHVTRAYFDRTFDPTYSQASLPYIKTAHANSIVPENLLRNFRSNVTRADFAAMAGLLMERVLGRGRANIAAITPSNSSVIDAATAAELLAKVAEAIGYTGSTANLVPSGTFTRENCIIAIVRLFELICD
jgi:hypothetical protein